MASTYSPNLRIELIGNGEQSNTWGTTTNTNLGTLIEQAISGLVSVDVTAGNVTLTSLNGASDQSRQMIIVATGTPGVTRTITAPAVNKVYIVYNNSNATLSFIASGGTGVSLSVGAKKLIYCDGTNFVEAINSVAITSGSINGTTIGATTASTGAFTTLSASSTVSGTGFSTYLASPPAIGATTASTGAFTTLSASSTVSGTGFSTYLASPPAIGGTTAAAGKFTTLEYTGTLTGGTGILNIGSGQLYKDASGNVGIGTSSPAKKLDVVGEAQISFNSINTYLYYQSTNNYTGRNTDGNMWMNVAGGQNNIFGIAGVEKMRIDSSGNVGIGTSSPASYGKLAVVGGNFYTSQAASPSGWATTTNANLNTGSYYFQLYTAGGNNVGQHSCNSSGEYLISTYSTTALLLGTNSTERMRIDSAGNVGIGTSSPATQLHIASATAKTRIDTTAAASNNPELQLTAVARQFNIGVGGATFATTALQGSYYIYDNTAATYRMVIDYAGNVGIGLTSPTGKLDVAGTIKTLGYTVASLPTGVVGARAYVTNALAPVYGSTVVAGGAVTIPVFYNGTNWIVG